MHAFGYVVPNRVIGRALWQALRAAPNIELAVPAQLKNATLRDDGVIAGRRQRWRTPSRCTRRSPWLPMARALCCARSAGIDANVEDYDQVAIVVNAATDRPNNGEAFERFTAVGSARGAAGGRWRIHRGVGRGAGRAPPNSSRSMTPRSPPSCSPPSAGAPGAGRRSAAATLYPLALSRADETVAGRVVLIGNAAQALHPVAGQGFNLGLRDAATLAEMLAAAARESDDPERIGELLGSVRRVARRGSQRRHALHRRTGETLRQRHARARAGAQFRTAAVRPEPDRQARVVARQLGIRRPHAAPGARPAARMNRERRRRRGRRRAHRSRDRACCSRARRASPRRASRCSIGAFRTARRRSSRPARGSARVRAVARQRKDPARRGRVGRRRATRAAPYERMQVWHADVPPHGGDALVFDAAEIGERDLGVIAENNVLQAALAAAARRAGIALEECEIDALEQERDAVVLRAAGASSRAAGGRRGRRAFARARARGARRDAAPTTDRSRSSPWCARRARISTPPGSDFSATARSPSCHCGRRAARSSGRCRRTCAETLLAATPAQFERELERGFRWRARQRCSSRASG